MARGSLFQLSCLSGPGESSTPLLAATIAAVPELPDLTVVAEAFHAALSGRPIWSAEAPGPLAVRGTPAELAALAGQRVERIARRGKFLLIDLDDDRVVVNPMLTGRFQLAAPGEKLPSKTAVVFRFGPRAGGPPDAASWTAGADWLPADDESPEVRYRDPTQMGKVYLVPAGVDRDVPGLDATQGPDADDPALTLEVWRSRIRRHHGELKNLLRNRSSSRASATRTPTRSSTRPGCSHSASVRRLLMKRSTACTTRLDRPSPTRSTCSGRGSRPPSRSRSGISSPYTTRAGRRVRDAEPASPRSRPAASSPRTAAAARAEHLV